VFPSPPLCTTPETYPFSSGKVWCFRVGTSLGAFFSYWPTKSPAPATRILISSLLAFLEGFHAACVSWPHLVRGQTLQRVLDPSFNYGRVLGLVQRPSEDTWKISCVRWALGTAVVHFLSFNAGEPSTARTFRYLS